MERLSIEEIIEHCKRIRATYEKISGVEMLETKDISNAFIKEYWEHRQVAEYLLELQQYRSIGTVKECRAAVEKQRAKKPNYPYLKSLPTCPTCGEVNIQDESEYAEFGRMYKRNPD